MRIRVRQTILRLAAMVLLGLAAYALPMGRLAAGECEVGEYEGEHDHERARHAVECGEIMPLADVLAAVKPHISGRIIEAEFERQDGVWIYELKFIDARGHMVELYVDAGSGRILKTAGDE